MYFGKYMSLFFWKNFLPMNSHSKKGGIRVWDIVFDFFLLYKADSRNLTDGHLKPKLATWLDTTLKMLVVKEVKV